MRRSRRTRPTRSPDKYETLVARLLASPHYGERWARYWLDVVRYAEDNPGNITNPPYPHAWRYRDWVIESLNKDVPYDRFVKLQLAADLMPVTSRSDLRALGIIALGPQDHKDVRLSVDVVGTLQLNDWDERLDTVSRGLLGLSVACARCHDHKFDPIRQQDYYRLQSVFASTQRALRPFFEIDPKTETRFMWVYQRMFDLHYTANLLESDPGSKPEQAARQVKKFRQELAALQAEIDAMSKAYPQLAAYIKTVPYPGEKAPVPPGAQGGGVRRPPKRKSLPPDLIANHERVQNAGAGGGPRKRIDPKAPFLNSVYDAGLWFNDSEPDLTFFDAKPGVPRDLPLFKGGNLNTPGDPAPRGFPLVLAKGPADFQNGSGRLELGEKIFTDAAPLSARVIVNRVWGWHFGQHLVGTPSDFGAQGLQPTHPELLDDLCREIHRQRLVVQVAAPRDHVVGHLSPIEPAAGGRGRGRPDQPVAVAHEPATAGHRGLPRFAASGRRNTRSDDVWAVRGHRHRETADRVRHAQPGAKQRRRHEALRCAAADAAHADAIPHDQSSAGAVRDEQRLRSEAGFRAGGRGGNGSRARGRRQGALSEACFPATPTQDEIALGVKYLAGADAARYAQALLSTNEVIFWP